MKTNNPPVHPSLDLAVFSTPQKKMKSVLQFNKQRERYKEDIIASGLPPKLAKLITDKHGTPKRIAPVVAMYTGRCHLTNMVLTDIGEGVTGVVYQHKNKRFISTLIADVIASSKMPEEQFIQLCQLVTRTKYELSSVGRKDSNQQTESRSDRRRPADVGEYRAEDFLGVRQ
jgi:hypothetical protein